MHLQSDGESDQRGSMSIVALIPLLLLVTACVPARVAQPIPMKQSADVDMTCEQIAIEYKSNTGVADGKIANNRRADKRELWLGILVWPGLMDLQNADGNEGNALLDRNVYLREVAKDKSCNGVDSWPTQPKRYT
jgi:hypothetical protein